MARITFVDIARGLAILQMAGWQVFDFFSTKNVYADAPFFIRAFNMPPHFSVLALFLATSGAGLFLSLKSRKKRGASWKQNAAHVLVHYGFYIAFSALFTTLMWDFCMFQSWSEAIQGVGITALVSFALLSCKPSKRTLLVIIMGLVIVQPIIKPLVYDASAQFPVCTGVRDASVMPSMVINALFRGFFSPLNLLPLFLVGVLVAWAYTDAKNKRAFMHKIRNIALVLTLFALFTHVAIAPINFYARNPHSVMLEVSVFLFAVSLYELLRTGALKRIISRILVPYGQNPLLAYLAHFILVLKPLQLLGLESTFGLVASLVGAFVFMIGLNVVLTKWIGIT
ncbi:hypothetical protein COT72_03525 [archaeon CG10_big_fil_rev_8_21_14_0_10_43_11]|nr:MAG: hypothetical protein COT72_03525 [archaeon CG10_big_fil_rev_8_21_14_0_10_43_11]